MTITTLQTAPLDADAVEPVDPFPPASDRPCWRCYEDAIKRGGKPWRPGVYFHGIKIRDGQRDADPIMTDEWVCGPLHVEATTANQEDGDHGRLLRYRNVNGNWKRWSMPMQMLAGEGVDVLGILMGEGLEIELKKKGRVLDYVNVQHPGKSLRAAATTGWHGGAFVLPDQVIGADDIWYQATERTAPYGTAGTLQGWQQEVAARAAGNPLLMAGISAAFAGVLLERLNIDGAGLHLFGDSSTGKTSVLMAAISVWGGSVFRRTWRTTSNGLEGAAKMHTGTLLALDEVSEVSPRDLYESAYALVNGHGKTRANVRGEARQVSRWRVFVLSTGEETVATRLELGGFEVKAGQGLRLLDVPVSGQYGAWDELHGLASGAAFSDAVRDGAARHYGHAGPAFVRALIAAGADGGELSAKLDAVVQSMGAADGQETRGARVFALCAVAGEMAASAGVVPWQPGQALAAARHVFGLWRNQRATGGRSAEDAAILRAVADFIERHGESRFSSLTANLNDAGRPVLNRAGYVNWSGATATYLFTSGGLKEAVKSFGVTRALAALDRAGAFAKKGTNAISISTRTPDGRTPRLYHINPGKLGDVGEQ